MKEIAIIGIGNILLRDDGIGIHVINQLSKMELPDNIKIIDGGSCVFDLIDIFKEKEKVIIVDSIKGGHQPGTIYRLNSEDIGDYSKESISLHSIQIIDILTMVRMMDYSSEVIIIGVEPGEIYFNLDLSSELEDKLPVIIDLIKEELKDRLKDKINAGLKIKVLK